MFSALQTLTSTTEQKPIMINISTTGISPAGKPRDIPIGWIPFYKWLLHSPHIDKQAMEDNVRSELAKPEAQRLIRGGVIVRPSFLAGESKGWENLKVGTDERPVRGYFVERSDVGKFMFERLVRQDVPEEWMNGGVHLTH
jgi:hypothetical protein